MKKNTKYDKNELFKTKPLTFLLWRGIISSE